MGQNDIGMCRMNHTEVNGYGYLGRIRLSTAGVTSFSTINFDITNVKVIDGFGAEIPVENCRLLNCN